MESSLTLRAERGRERARWEMNYKRCSWSFIRQSSSFSFPCLHLTPHTASTACLFQKRIRVRRSFSGGSQSNGGSFYQQPSAALVISRSTRLLWLYERWGKPGDERLQCNVNKKKEDSDLAWWPRNVCPFKRSRQTLDLLPRWFDLCFHDTLIKSDHCKL